VKLGGLWPRTLQQPARPGRIATWAYGQGSAFTTYVTALETADNAYIASVNSAANTLGPIGLPTPGQLGPGGAASLAGTVIGNVGMSAISPRTGASAAGFGPVPLP
jgi:hypothetical protein